MPASTASGRSVVSRITSTGLPSEGASSWTPPRVGQDQVARVHQADEGQVVERLDQVDVGDARRAAAFTGSRTFGLRCTGIDDLDVGDASAELARARAQMRSKPSPKFSRRWPVTRTMRALPAQERRSARRACAQVGVAVDARVTVEQRVDHRVAGDEDASAVDALRAAGCRATRSVGAKCSVGERADELAVHLLGPGRVEVAGAQAGLDVADRDAAGRRPPATAAKRGRRVALDQHAGRALASQARRACRVRTAAVMSVSVWPGASGRGRSRARCSKSVEHLVEHLPVLRGDADAALERRGSAASACTTGAILIASGRVPKTHKDLKRHCLPAR